MADITQSFSQLLLTYGPGAMLDLPDQAVIVSGLQGWRFGPNMKTIAEDRLIALLRDQLGNKLSPTFSGLRQPPEQDEERRDDRAPGVEVLLFPSWFTVDEDGNSSDGDGDGDMAATNMEKRRRMVEFDHLTVTKGGKLSYKDDRGKRREVNPIRFVAACTKGHLQDIGWRYLVHRNGDQACRKPMYWVERGVSSDPSDISVRCTCGSMLTMADLYKPKFLGTCRAESPWLQPQRLHDEECGIDLRLLPRSATNTYFAQTVTVISLTNSDSRVRQTVQEHRPTIDSIRALPNFIDVLRSLPHTKEAFSEFSDADILRALDEEAGDAPASTNPRIAEFDILASGARFIGHDGPASHLFAETMPIDELELNQPWRDFLAGVIKVHRLREVTCLYGFTRLEPPPTAAESELDEIQLAVDGADLARNVEWLPTIEQFGEGIFLHVNPDFLNLWRNQAAVGERTLVLREGERLDAERFGRPPSHLGIAYWALHSLSHALMSELSLECGYPLSSLKERVYSSGAGQADRYGLLIYTSTAGGQGTLGGLSGMAHRVGELLTRAMKRLELCSNDPICAEHSPDGDHDDRHLHGAACHACLLIPETSCEARNTRLDRGLLVPTVVGSRFACVEIP